MPFAFNADRFRSSLLTGPAKVGRYSAAIFGMPDFFNSSGIGNFLTDAAGIAVLPLRINSITMPGKQFQTMERGYSGAKRLIPYDVINDRIQMTVIEDEAFTMRRFFERWMSRIHEDSNAEVSGSSTSRSYTTQYYDKITASRLQIHCYNDFSPIPVYVQVLEEVFPLSIGNVEQTWDAENQIMTIPIEMTFREWRNIDNEVAKIGSSLL